MGFTEDLCDEVNKLRRRDNPDELADILLSLRRDDFSDGARWAHERVSNKGVGHLTDFMKNVANKRIEKLEGVIRFAAGLVSTMEQFKDKHPQEVEEWLYQQYNHSTNERSTTGGD